MDRVYHTSYNSFYKWTKISSLEIIIFTLKNDSKICPEWPNWPGNLAGISEGAWSISK